MLLKSVNVFSCSVPYRANRFPYCAKRGAQALGGIPHWKGLPKLGFQVLKDMAKSHYGLGSNQDNCEHLVHIYPVLRRLAPIPAIPRRLVHSHRVPAAGLQASRVMGASRQAVHGPLTGITFPDNVRTRRYVFVVHAA